MPERYDTPNIEDFGRLEVLTADVGHFGLGMGGIAGASVPQAPPSGPPDTLGNPDLPDGDVLGGGGGEGGGGGGGESGGGAGGGGGVGGGGGSSLPFTGLAVGLFAAIGGGLTALGSALRRAARRRG